MYRTIEFIKFALLLAASVLLFSTYAYAADLNYEAEDMILPASGTTMISQTSASGGKALKFTANVMARQGVTYTDPSDQIVIRARGGQAGGSPQLRLLVKNGSTVTTVGTKNVTSSVNYAEYTFDYSAPAGAVREIQILSLNIATDRNLFVDDFIIKSSAPPLDSTPPNTTITSGPTEGSTQSSDSATILFTSSEPNSTFQCKLDTGAYEACGSGTKTYSGLANGSHTFSVKAKDAAGNEDAAPAVRSWTVNVVQSPPQQANTADSFIQSIGVDTHIAFFTTPYGNYAQVKAALEELGVKHARDAAPALSNSTAWSRYKDLYTTLGIRYTLNANEDTYVKPATPQQFNQMKTLGGGAIEAFEGPNEYNFTNLDGSNPDWDSVLEAYHRGMFQNLNNSALAGLPLLAAPLGVSGNYPSKTPELGPYSDANNMHSYPGPAMPTGSHRSEWQSLLFDRDIPKAEEVGAPRRPLYATETGYTTAPDHILEVSDTAKAHYLPRLSFEYFNADIARGYHYQLLDHKIGTTPQAHYGLIAYNGTKKPAFRSMENTIDILEDPGPRFATSSLDYTLANTTPNIHQTLLQKRNGTFYLALWQEVHSYDFRNDQPITVTPQEVTVRFSSAMKTVRVFDPTNIASSGPTDDAERHPSRTLSSVSSVTEPIGDQVKIIEVTKP